MRYKVEYEFLLTTGFWHVKKYVGKILWFDVWKKEYLALTKEDAMKWVEYRKGAGKDEEL